ncbi:MAG: Fic family protein [Coriobacteriia bacterium]|nr:Fic family protein [Coriobacteriia bacterium]MBS5477108.1 Fic family protein [Coriobacteriia bacterium]
MPVQADIPRLSSGVIKAALIHYQFETIHPFLDGNGRLGRLLIVLSLVNDGVLKTACLYPSYQLKARRTEYYSQLMRVRMQGDYAEWIRFFCQCLLDSAVDAGNSMRELVELHAQNERIIREHFARGASNALNLLDLLERNPIADIAFIASRIELSRTSVSNLVREFCELGILCQRDTRKQRYREYLYEDYLKILRAGSEPIPRG